MVIGPPKEFELAAGIYHGEIDRNTMVIGPPKEFERTNLSTLVDRRG
jgi:hypothetical protein